MMKGTTTRRTQNERLAAVAIVAGVLLAGGMTAAAEEGEGSGSARGVGLLRVPPGIGLARVADADGNAVVTGGEWEALLSTLDGDADGVVRLETLIGALPEAERPRGAGPSAGRRRLDRDDSAAVEPHELDELFATLDGNGDGTIERSELEPPADLVERQRGRGSLATAIVRKADADADRRVTAEEWQTAVVAATDPEDGTVQLGAFLGADLAEREARRVQRRDQVLMGRFDRDANGSVELDDLRELFTKMDENGDGQLAAEELAPQRSPSGDAVK